MQGNTKEISDLSDTKEISDFYHELSIKNTNALFPKKESCCIMLYFQKAAVFIQWKEIHYHPTEKQQHQL